MADTVTPNLGFVKPEVGGSNDTWGNKTNDNWDKSDTAIQALRDGKIPLSLYATKSTNYQIVKADLNKYIDCTAALTITFDLAANLGAGFGVNIIARGGDVLLDPSESINGGTSLNIPQGQTVYVLTDGLTFFTPPVEQSPDPWAYQPLGSYIALDGAATPNFPPTDKKYRYVDLTAGLSGAGGYNEGVLISEVVSGSAPLISAVATVSLAGSYINGQVIRLINTERRFLRAGSPGVVQDDAFQNFSGFFETRKGETGGSLIGGVGGAVAFSPSGTANARLAGVGVGAPLSADTITITPANDGNARTTNETRSRNIGVRVFRRIK